jgi:folate-binding protein YgfZ
LSWLHDMTTQHLAKLRPDEGTEALFLGPNGHVEQHVVITDDGTTTWLDTEPDSTAPLLDWLNRMRFMLRVDPTDVTGQWALLSLVGPAASIPGVELAAPVVAPVPGAKFASNEVAKRPTTSYSIAPRPDGGWVRRMSYGYDLLVPRSAAAGLADELGVPWAGIWAFEALRVAGRHPRLGFETDHRTIPAEVGWLADTVNLDKGCYRGQETVARVHNMGRPPRRLVLLHLDGVTTDQLPARGTPVTAEDGREVGFVGTAVRHYELGQIALAVLKRNTPDDAPLRIGQSAALIDPEATDPQS